MIADKQDIIEKCKRALSKHTKGGITKVIRISRTS